MKTRVRGATTTALVALVISLVAFGETGAVATQDQAIIAGQNNSETLSTCVYQASGSSSCHGDAAIQGDNNQSNQYGVEGTQIASSGAGVFGIGGLSGVLGESAVSGGSGVKGEVFGTANANGVFGHANNTGGSGVYGQNDGSGYGVAGRADTGTGVFGDSPGGTGVWASTEGGTALKVTAGTGGTGVTATAPTSGTALSVSGTSKFTGKTQFSRSGTASVLATKSSVVVSNIALSSKSLVLATAQKNVAGIYVQAAVPNVASKTITIYLNKTVTASYPVAWMVIERP